MNSEKQVNECRTCTEKEVSLNEKLNPEDHINGMPGDRPVQCKPQPIGNQVGIQNKPIRDKLALQNESQPIGDKLPHQNEPQPIGDKLAPQNESQLVGDKVSVQSKPQPIGDKVKVHDRTIRQKLVDILSKFNGSVLVLPKWTGTIKLVSLLKQNVPNDNRHDTPSKLLCCGQCDKTFKQKRSLDAHINVHKGIYPFKCETCDKSFSCKNFLQQHEKTHSAERGHHCTVRGCSKSFRTNSR